MMADIEPTPDLNVLIRMESSEVAQVSISQDKEGTVYSTTLDGKLGEHLILVRDLPPQRIFDKTIDEIMHMGTCLDAVVTRIQGRGRGVGAELKLRLRIEGGGGSTAINGSGPQVGSEIVKGVAIVSLKGSLDVENVSKLEKEIRKVWDNGVPIVLDLDPGDKFIATAARVLTDLIARFLKQGQPRLFLTGQHDRIRETFERANLLDAFEVHRSVKDVFEAMQPKILVFDLDPAVRDAVEHQAKELAIKINSYPGARDALKLVQKKKPNLVMIGMSLEDGDSLQTVKDIRNNPQSALIPVAILADDKRAETVRSCIDAGCTDYLLKPLGPDAILRAFAKAGIGAGKED